MPLNVHRCIALLLLFAHSWGRGSSFLTYTDLNARGGWLTDPSRRTAATAARPTRTSSSSSATTAADPSSEVSADSSAPALTLFSPCKVNLFLRILRKRDDGFHDLASLFQAVGFGDTLELTPLDIPSSIDEDSSEAESRTDVFTCNMEGVPTDSRNLVIRALELMRQKTGIGQYYRANLIKQVPAQAGLGGGSANAATAMWGANELMGRPASLDEMVEWSAELGSDITFFLSRGTAYCTGRGEITSSIEPPLPSGTRLCIVKPDIGLSTPAVFKALNYDELSPLDADEVLLPTFLSTTPIDEVPVDCFVNDLEPPAFRCVPELKQLKDELLQVPGFKRVMMSGSGTSIFCLGEPNDAESFRESFVSRDGLQVFFTEFISRPEGSWFERPAQL